MNQAQASAMYLRRGSIISWLHSIPASPTTLDPTSGGPKATLGGPRLTNTGNFGETFLPPVKINAYFQSKTTSFTQQPFGAVDVGDAQLTFVVPYVQSWETAVLRDANPEANPPIVATTPSLSDYNNGNFADIQNETSLRMDRFVIYGQTWSAKAVPVPLSDGNGIFAWRLLIGKVGV